MRSKTNRLIKWWLTPKFPEKQIENFLKFKPSGINNKIRNYYRTWVLHPIRRRVAKYYLIVLRKFFGLKVIGITGSAGKTTTKEFLASILSRVGATVYSYANIDPVYNIPTTILKCTPKTRYLILEMGVEFPGEMDFYIWLAKPDVGIITNIFPTHTEFFGSMSGVFREKSKLAMALWKDNTVILNKNDKLLKGLINKVDAMVEWFGAKSGVSSSSEKITEDFKTEFLLNFGKNKTKVNLSVLGYQYVINALAASAAAKSLGIDITQIKEGLESFDAPPHRMSVLRLKNGAVVIDDSYNNNPNAAKESLKVFAEISRKKDKVIVFGDMKELGSLEHKHHVQIGEFIAKKIKPNFAICVGRASQFTSEVIQNSLGKNRSVFVSNPLEALEYLKKTLSGNMVVLIKGSRSIGLDIIIDML